MLLTIYVLRQFIYSFAPILNGSPLVDSEIIDPFVLVDSKIEYQILKKKLNIILLNKTNIFTKKIISTRPNQRNRYNGSSKRYIKQAHKKNRRIRKQSQSTNKEKKWHE